MAATLQLLKSWYRSAQIGGLLPVSQKFPTSYQDRLQKLHTLDPDVQFHAAKAIAETCQLHEVQPLQQHVFELAEATHNANAAARIAVTLAHRLGIEHTLPQPAHTKTLASGLEPIIRDEDTTQARVALRIAAVADAHQLIPAVVARVGDEDLVNDAARAAAMLAETAHTREWDDPIARAARNALLETARDFDQHRQRDLLLALALMYTSPRGIRELDALLQQTEEEPLTLGLRSILRKSDHPALAEARVRWLSRDTVGASAGARLWTEETRDALEDLLVHAHLFHDPHRAGAFTKRRPTDDASCAYRRYLERLDGAALNTRLGALELLDTAGPDFPTESVAIVALADPSPRFRMAALRRITADDRRAPLAGDFCFDADATVASAALLRNTFRTRRSDAPMMRHLSRSPHARVRTMAGRAAADHVSGAARRVERRTMARDDRDAFLNSVRRELRNAVMDPENTTDADIVSTIRLVDELALVDLVELELLTIAGRLGEVSDVVVSCVATALRSGTSEATFNACVKLMNAKPDRVRANAVESIERRMRRSNRINPDLIAPLVRDKHHRVNSTAARAMFRLGRRAGTLACQEQATNHVGRMLADARPAHRVAGLWLTSRLNEASAWADNDGPTGLVDHLARHDESEAVRTHARRCLLWITNGVRAGWAGRAPELSHAG